jgi:hypothetical protein
VRVRCYALCCAVLCCVLRPFACKQELTSSLTFIPPPSPHHRPSCYINDCLTYTTPTPLTAPHRYLASCTLSATNPLVPRLRACLTDALSTLDCPRSFAFHGLGPLRPHLPPSACCALVFVMVLFVLSVFFVFNVCICVWLVRCVPCVVCAGELWHTADNQVVFCEVACRAGGAGVVPAIQDLFKVDLNKFAVQTQCGDKPTSPIEESKTIIPTGNAGWMVGQRLGSLRLSPAQRYALFFASSLSAELAFVLFACAVLCCVVLRVSS